MIGDYLTTSGRSVDDDLKMFDDLKLRVRGDTQQRRRNAEQSRAASA
jgi:biotin synthase-like enzyme